MSKNSHEFDKETGAFYGNYQSYLVGYISSIVLTLLAFSLVGSAMLPPKTLYLVVGSCAVIQLLVQVKYFLHINTSPEGSWNLLSFLFTLVVVLVLVIGTLWIMYNLYANMGMNSMAM